MAGKKSDEARRCSDLRSVPASQRDDDWQNSAWICADRLRKLGATTLAEDLEDACERAAMKAAGQRVPRQRRSP